MKRPCMFVGLWCVMVWLTGCPPGTTPPIDENSDSNLDDRNESSDSACEPGFVLAAAEFCCPTGHPVLGSDGRCHALSSTDGCEVGFVAVPNDLCCPEDYPELGSDGRCHQPPAGNGGAEPQACVGNALAIVAPTVATYVVLENGSVYNAGDAVKGWSVGDCIQIETRTISNPGIWLPSVCNFSGFCTVGSFTGASTSTSNTLLNVRTGQTSDAVAQDMAGFHAISAIIDLASGARWVELNNGEQYPVDPDDYEKVASWSIGQSVALADRHLVNVETGYVVGLMRKNSPNGCCNVSGGGLGCNSQGTMACVCSRDQFCCDGEWDRQCVALAEYYGCESCNSIGDPCEALGWYGDAEGICDSACPRLDPDCALEP